MIAQPGLFDLPDPPPTPAVRAPRDRGRRGEHWTRNVVAGLNVVDRGALRDAAHRRLSEGIAIDLGPADDLDEDLLDPHEEIAISSAAAVRWWIDPTAGTWPELAEALRLDAVDLDATDETPRQVRASWSVTVTMTDLDVLRTLAAGPGRGDATFPGLWNHGLEFRDSTLDRAAAPGQREPVANGVVVLEQASGEPRQVRDIAGLGLRDPGVEELAAELAEQPTEVTNQHTDGAQDRAPFHDPDVFSPPEMITSLLWSRSSTYPSG